MTRTEGYVAGVDYMHGFYREMTPAMHQLALLASGIETGVNLDRMHYCELGCGHGLGVNLLAALHPGSSFYANDISPEHIASARKLAKQAGLTNIHFFADTFEDFGARDLPEFDAIVLHGVYSWVSAANRQRIVDFISKKLKVGGVVYVSYNSHPGWAASIPLRDFMLAHAGPPTEPVLLRIERALQNVQALFDANSAFLRVNPSLKEKFDRIKTQPKKYLAHEFFNRDWTIFHHADVAREFSAAMLEFAASAYLLDDVESINFTQEQQNQLRKIEDRSQSQILRDFYLNKAFRRDLFVKGALRLAPAERLEQLADTHFILTSLSEKIPRKITTLAGSADLKAEVLDPVLRSFSSSPLTIRQMLEGDRSIGLPLATVLEMVLILVGAGHMHPCLESDQVSAAKAPSRNFNDAILRRARVSGDIGFLASPLTGTGIQVDRIEQLFLLGRQLNEADLVGFVWQCLSTRGESLIHEGQALQTPEANLQRLNELHVAFVARLPLLQRLGVAH